MNALQKLDDQESFLWRQEITGPEHRWGYQGLRSQRRWTLHRSLTKEGWSLSPKLQFDSWIIHKYLFLGFLFTWEMKCNTEMFDFNTEPQPSLHVRTYMSRTVIVHKVDTNFLSGLFFYVNLHVMWLFLCPIPKNVVGTRIRRPKEPFLPSVDKFDYQSRWQMVVVVMLKIKAGKT